MNPEQRKEASELQLHKRGIRINVQLHVIESDEEVTLRKPDQLLARMLALWAVSTAAQARDCLPMRAYLATYQLESCLSAQESAFLFGAAPDEASYLQFAQSQEALYFLAWCAGLSDKIAVPATSSNLKPVLKFFPYALEAPDKLQAAIRPRSKSAIMDWSDLLYRLHWEVRHTQLTGRPCPASIDATVIKQWHQAVNWICQYEEENDWDKVSTET
ncbi:DUF4272 domain-containing protein [Undibacterium sp. Ren11W]|uniref:DUF4272 domain-containing protein n=1 Tax=Undibacterium sp. Ren11W TaxID=3413045 RepID=UPI003BF38CAD